MTTEAWENIALPETVQAVVRSRLDRLDEATREVVLNASVIGREFGAGLLEVLMPGHQRILAALEKLKALGFVQQVHVVPELEFRFKHVVTQEVAYDIQLLARRRVLHRIIADHLEARQSQGQAQRSEILAMHFLKGEVWPRAVFHSQAAADQAKSHFAHSVALKLSHQALDAA